MKTKLETITIERWSCHHEAHRHRVKEIAENCIKRSQGIKLSFAERDKRDLEITRAHINGKSSNEIGVEFGLLANNVCAISRGTRHKAMKISSGKPPCSHTTLFDVRVNKKWWLKSLKELEKSLQK